jgi:signal transduction histidine kinase
MEAADLDKKASVLVLEDSSQEYARAQGALVHDLPGVEVAQVRSQEELLHRIQLQSCDIVILDCEWPLDRLLGLKYQLQNNDYQPSLIVVSSGGDSRLISELNRHRRQRVILKGEYWVEELAPAVRHELRLRQLEEENIAIKARLTEANQLLNERNRRLDEFSATLAHDIRGPLGGVSMKLEYILENYKGPIEPRVTDLVTRCLNSCRRLAEMVQAMYEYARLGPEATKMQKIDLNELVSGVLGDGRFDEALDIRVEVGRLPLVWGNPSMLRRVFLNLLGNAVKYNDKKEIVLRLEAGGIKRRGLGEFCEISVEDNGPGIASEELADVFTMFRRGSAAKNDGEGSGIGLAVVQRIVELHYGDIRVESQPGHGTRFTFTLPLEDVRLLVRRSD